MCMYLLNVNINVIDLKKKKKKDRGIRTEKHRSGNSSSLSNYRWKKNTKTAENWPKVRFNLVVATRIDLATLLCSDDISCMRSDFFEQANERRRLDAFARTAQSGSFVAGI